jgi:hypothetical protein
MLSLRCADHHPHQDWGLARAAGNRLARDDKKPGPQLGVNQLPGERPRETAETRHTSSQPRSYVSKKGAAPLCGAEEQAACAISASEGSSLLSLQMKSIN